MAMAWMAMQPMSPQQLAERLGFLPQLLDDGDPRSAKEQMNTNYAHGGGWNKFDGFTMSQDKMSLRYPGDPPFKLIAVSQLHDEVLMFYEHDWLVIMQPDETWEAARVD
jgi:hypothetical protein